MHDDDGVPQPFSAEARHLFSYIVRHNGSMRIAPLVRGSGLAPDALAAAANELAARRWVTVTWRHPRAVMPDGLPERFREVERIATTPFGRWRHSVTWPEPAAIGTLWPDQPRRRR